MSPRRAAIPSKTKACRELELKLSVTPDSVDHLRKVRNLSGWSLQEPHDSQLRSVYFDTADHRLRTAGLSLRVRSEGKTFTQTVKSGTRPSDGLSNPVEVEAVLKSPEPQLARISNKKLRRKILDVVADVPLVPIFETDVARTSRRVKKNNVSLELALDEGSIRAGERELPILEAELELKSGARADMLSAAEALFAEIPFEFAHASKAERGYELILGRPDGGPPAKRSEQPSFDKGASCRDVLGQLVHGAANQIIANRDVVIKTDDPEGAHQLRVGLRRLRTALRAFGPLLDDKEKNLAAHAQTLARVVGELRDADVLHGQICAPLDGDGQRPAGRDELRAALWAHRMDMRDKVRKSLDGAAWRTLQLELALWPPMLADIRLLVAPISDWAPQALDRVWKKASKRARNIADLEPPDRHALRKALKKLRYCAEYFGQLYAERDVKDFIKQLKLLQDIFGYLNDAATASKVIEIARVRSKPASPCREVAAYIVGWHAARAETCWKDAQQEWGRLKKQGRFWR